MIATRYSREIAKADERVGNLPAVRVYSVRIGHASILVHISLNTVVYGLLLQSTSDVYSAPLDCKQWSRQGGVTYPPLLSAMRRKVVPAGCQFPQHGWRLQVAPTPGETGRLLTFYAGLSHSPRANGVGPAA